MRTVATTLAALSAAALSLAGCAGGQSQTDAPGEPRRTVAVDLVAQGASPDNTFALVDLYADDGVVTGTFLASPADIWTELPAVYEEVGIGTGDLAVFDPVTRRIGVREHRIRRIDGKRLSGYLRCGTALGAPKADNGQVRLTLTTWVGSEDAETTVSTKVRAWTRDQGTSTGPLTCQSNGALEREILERLQLRLLRPEG